jgi:parallel beta-helix repeat protein
MSHHAWFRLAKSNGRATVRARIRTFIPRIEALEERTQPSTLVVSPGGIVPGSFASVQQAVNAANQAGGDTILIDPGTYTEQVTINKSLSIQGNPTGAIIQAPATLNSDLGQTALVEIGSTMGSITVNMSALTLEGPGPSTGIYIVRGATANITGTTIDKMRQNPLNGVQTGRGILVGSTGQSQVAHAIITGCTITDYQKSGIVTGGTGTTVTVTGTTVTGVGPTSLIAQNGIQITEGTTAMVDNNTVSGNEFTGTNSGPDPTLAVQSIGIFILGSASVSGNKVMANDVGIDNAGSGTPIDGNTAQSNRFVGILVHQGSGTISNNIVTGNNIGVAVEAVAGDTVKSQATLISNTITNNGNGGLAFPGGGIRLLVGTGATTTPAATANFNRLIGNALGLGNATAATVDATNNWWGSNAGPGGAGSDTVSGPVNFNPWLVLQVTPSPNSVQPLGTASIVASLTTNSAGMNTSALGHVPDGIPVSFSATSGAVAPTAGATSAGTAATKFTAGSSAGTVPASATIDNQTETAQIKISVLLPPTPPAGSCNIPSFAVTPNQKFIAQVYCDLLGRTVDAGGLAAWTGLLDHGTPAPQVVLDIEFAPSNEYQTIVVENIYQAYLHRAADPAGLQAGVAFLNSGGTNEQLAAIIAGSPEFFALAGMTNAGFLNALYVDALGRPVDPGGAASWGGLLAQGVSRSTVALGILSSVEYHTELVQSYYQKFLRRAADPVGLAGWVGLLQQGSTDQQVIADIIGSPEYFSQASTGSFPP